MTTYLCYRGNGEYFHGTSDGYEAVCRAKAEADRSGTYADAVQIKDGEISRVRFYADGKTEKREERDGDADTDL